jgi:hypothetical protein
VPVTLYNQRYIRQYIGEQLLPKSFLSKANIKIAEELTFPLICVPTHARYVAVKLCM